MRNFAKRIFYSYLNLRIMFLKMKARLLGDYIINCFIERTSARELPYALQRFGANVSESTNIHQGLILDNTYFKYENLTIMDNCYIGKKVFFDMAKPITIKSGAVLSAGVCILTHQDVGERPLSKYYSRKEGTVILDEGCFIGANSTILCGVRIGKCAVVAAGSVVNRDVPDYTVVGGVPARYIKELIKLEPTEE